jgi:hypothetical protein
MTDLTGKRALVTGASSGIGAALAHELAGHGVDLVLTARRRDPLDRVAEACRARGVHSDIITADLGLPGAATALWQTASAAGPIDILINNAGFGYLRPFSAVDWQRDAELLQLNVVSLVELSRRFVDHHTGHHTGHPTSHPTGAPQPAAGRAYLLNVASIGAYQAVPNMALYASSKAFVRNFTEALHDELRGSRISATCVCPGGTTTGFHDAAGAGNYSWIARRTMMSPASVAQLALAAMQRGRRNVVPGLLNKLATWSVRLVSRRQAARLSGRVLGAPGAAALPERRAA